ncbi:unnamed protein product [Schistocephalus solidus]|uniref:Dual specificity tyrosine-phosphorylation-regulated kinase 3 n=1 Tax=Schistocephalus solidus TaxID=70667 RepID=A0A183SQ95_SCHSO|nr:unnamed protein product [Schistocephalus solidus]
MGGCVILHAALPSELRFFGALLSVCISAHEEINILERLRRFNPDPTGSTEHYPIVTLIDHFMFRDHMCLTFELLGESLYDLIKRKKGQGLERDRVRCLMSSVLDGLVFIKDAGIIHCDLKPENVLLMPTSPDSTNRDMVKIIDFGSSCLLHKQCYPYIQSRFYRAPEVIMRLEYSQPIDMWSFGCLVFEMIRGFPLFPGEDEFDQIACMMEKLGIPPEDMIRPSRVYNRYFYDRDAGSTVISSGDSSRNINIIPRYCNLKSVPGGGVELQQNLSRRLRRLRRVPGSVPLKLAMVSTMSHQTGNSTIGKLTPSKADEVDNFHVVKLLEACLRWQPEQRIGPDKAKKFSWFSYSTGGLTVPVSLLSKSTQDVSTIEHSSVHTRANVSSHSLIVDNQHISKKVPKSQSKRGSSASITSSENKQEERVIYARVQPFPKSPKTSQIPPSSRAMEYKLSAASDVSLFSTSSSVEDRQQPSLFKQYARNAGAAERFKENKDRKRNRSVANPRRYTQPIELGAEAENHQKENNRNPFSCKTATMDSPELASPHNGRHNPNQITAISKQDLTAVVRRATSPVDNKTSGQIDKNLGYRMAIPHPQALSSVHIVKTQSDGEFRPPKNYAECTLEHYNLHKNYRPKIVDQSARKGVRDAQVQPDPTRNADGNFSTLPSQRTTKAPYRSNILLTNGAAHRKPNIQVDSRRRSNQLFKKATSEDHFIDISTSMHGNSSGSHLIRPQVKPLDYEAKERFLDESTFGRTFGNPAINKLPTNRALLQ